MYIKYTDSTNESYNNENMPPFQVSTYCNVIEFIESKEYFSSEETKWTADKADVVATKNVEMWINHVVNHLNQNESFTKLSIRIEDIGTSC